jgi:hypothetical protein
MKTNPIQTQSQNRVYPKRGRTRKRAVGKECRSFDPQIGERAGHLAVPEGYLPGVEMPLGRGETAILEKTLALRAKTGILWAVS